MTKVCLVIVFNHNYEKNLEKLERLYKDRFDDVFYLMPFYSGNRPDVIPVYQNSFLFQGYFVQGLSSFYDEKYTHYIFAADDLIFNTSLNQENIIKELNLDNESGFIHGLSAINYPDFLSSNWVLFSILNFFNYNGVKTKAFLPDYETAVKSFKKHNLTPCLMTEEGVISFLKYAKKSLSHSYQYSFDIDSNSKEEIFEQLEEMDGTPIIPTALNCVDFIVIPGCKIKEFCHLCGIFTAMNVFVEIAIPTAMILTLDKIVTIKDIPYENQLTWNNEIKSLWEEKYNLSVENLFSSSDSKNILFYHPIKLSRWRLNDEE